MTASYCIGGVLLACALTIAAPMEQGARALPNTDLHSDAVVLFHAQLADYIAFREEVKKRADIPSVTPSEQSDWLERRRLGKILRAERAGIETGNIFRGIVARDFRARAGELMRSAMFRTWLKMREDYPPLRANVNGRYPLLAEHDVPSVLLRHLPALPFPVMYRVVGNDLVLWDEEADVVIDVLRDCFATVTTRAFRRAGAAVQTGRVRPNFSMR